MKRCPQCNRVESDETLKFCRSDGAVLVEDASVSDQFSATRVLPSSPTGGTQVVPTDPGHAEAITSGLKPAKQPKLETDEPGSSSRSIGSGFFITRLKLRKTVAILAGALLITAAAVFFYSYFTHSSKSGATIDSIAVLPFVNAGGDPNNEYLSDGITESIINSLSQLPNLGVIARNSAFRYKGKDTDAPTVGRELNVRSVLTGRVVQRGDNLSISVELVDTSNNHQLWGQQYSRKLADVFALQEEIANAISEKLRLRLSGTERQQLAKRPTENLKAFQYYIQGMSYAQRRTREDLLTTIRFCEQAIAEDPNYALAYAGLADAYIQLGIRSYVEVQESRRKAEEYSRKALVLDENLAEAHVAVGFRLVCFSPYDFELGEREMRRAIELSPSLARAHQQLGISLARRGRFDEGLTELLVARDLDPLSSIIARQVANPYYLKRDNKKAIEILRQANQLGPAFTAPWEIGVYIQNKLFDEALDELEKAKRGRSNDPILIYSTGMVYAAQGKRAEALRTVKELEELSASNLSEAHWIAKIYATLNDKELALSWLERGVAQGAITIFYRDEPVWDPIRSDPRFADLLRRMGIPQ